MRESLARRFSISRSFLGKIHLCIDIAHKSQHIIEFLCEKKQKNLLSTASISNPCSMVTMQKIVVSKPRSTKF